MLALSDLGAGCRRTPHRTSGSRLLTCEGTILEVLTTAAEAAPDQVIVEVAADGSEQVLTYQDLLTESLRVAGGLRAAGLVPGTPVLVLAGRSGDFLPGFWGALAAGLVPVPLAPVPDRVAAVWTHLDRPPLLVAAEVARVAGQFAGTTGSPGPRLLPLDELRAAEPLPDLHRPVPDDVAFLQFSSGSTGAPKGIALSHANVVANLRQARTAGAATESDVVVSWLPYFHDMGLIGAHLAPLSVLMKQVKLDPADFGKRPALWYETAARHAATLLPMASFALALTLKRVSAAEVAALDLSSVRLVSVGAEPIPVPTWRRFLTHLAPARLAPSALVPVYGLAEATLAVAFPPLGEVARPLTLDRQALAKGRAVDVSRVTAPAPAPRPARRAPIRPSSSTSASPCTTVSSASSTSRAQCWPTRSSARSSSAGRTSRRATTGNPRRRRTRSLTAGCGPATSGSSATAGSASPVAPRT